MKAIVKNRNHPSTAEIKNNTSGETFKFSTISGKDIIRKIKKLRTTKAVQSTNIPLKIIRTALIYLGAISLNSSVIVLSKVFSRYSETCKYCTCFQNWLQQILPVTSKIFEKLICKQINLFMSQYLSNIYLYSSYVGKWNETIDKRNIFGVGDDIDSGNISLQFSAERLFRWFQITK